MPLQIRTFNKRLEALRAESNNYECIWQELSDYHLAHRGRFLTTETNRASNVNYTRNTTQINNTSRMASRTLASGMMSGITSPARPWFRLGTGAGTADLKSEAVSQWLHDVEKIMYQVFSQSNLYNSLHQIYSELGVFGVGALGVYQDFDNVIWCKPYTIGSYYVGLNGKNEADSFYREYEISVAQCIKQFGKENVSSHVLHQWDSGNTEAYVQIVHAVEPNDDRDMNSPLARDKAWRSVYYECGDAQRRGISGRGIRKDVGKDKFLKISGFDEFPVMIPRWDVTAEDTYATDCPGMTALGDTKALQLAERRKYQAIDVLVNPPLQGPSSLKNKVPDEGLAPGDVVYHEGTNGGLTSIYQNYRPEINVIQQEIQITENRIKRAFYEDLFLMLAQTDRRQITAREVAEKHEEKLLMLGPVLERLHTELLDPLIDRTFNILQENGVFPVPPPELQNSELNVEYVSVLAQAQQLVNLGAVDRIIQFTGSAAALWPEARHKIDINKAVDGYSEALGIDPSVVRGEDEAAEMAQAEQQAAQQAAQVQQAGQAAAAAKTASDIDVSDGSAVAEVMRQAGLG